MGGVGRWVASWVGGWVGAKFLGPDSRGGNPAKPRTRLSPNIRDFLTQIGGVLLKISPADGGCFVED